MSAIGTTALPLRIAEFKFTYNFIICDQLPETELIFGIDTYKENFHYHMHGTRKKIVTFKKKANFSTYTKNCKQKATIGTVKSTLKIPP